MDDIIIGHERALEIFVSFPLFFLIFICIQFGLTTIYPQSIMNLEKHFQENTGKTSPRTIKIPEIFVVSIVCTVAYRTQYNFIQH